MISLMLQVVGDEGVAEVSFQCTNSMTSMKGYLTVTKLKLMPEALSHGTRYCCEWEVARRLTYFFKSLISYSIILCYHCAWSMSCDGNSFREVQSRP